MTVSSTSQLSAAQPIEQALQQAVICHRAGKLQEAEDLYAAILQVQPRHPDANHNLGVLKTQQRQFEASLSYFVAAIEADPTSPQYWLSYAEGLLAAGHVDDARQVILLARQHGLEGKGVDALAARIDATTMQLPEAPSATQQATPGRQEVENVVMLFNQGRYAEGELLARELTTRFPHFGYGWNALGAMLCSLGRGQEAVQAYKMAAVLSPQDAEVQNNMGATYWDLGLWSEAETCHRRALALKPDYAEAHFNLANALKAQGRRTEEEASLRDALRFNSTYAEAYDNLGVLMMERGELTAAEVAHRRAIAINPNLVKARNNLGVALKEQGRFAEAEASYRVALRLDPSFVAASSNLLFAMNCGDDYAQADCLRQARQYGALVARLAQPFTHWKCESQPQRLRVGLVSGDFRNHPVGYFLESLLTHLDTTRIEIVAYSTQPTRDELTARIEKHVSAWKPLSVRSDAAAAHAIVDDGIHILIDLAGHTGNNRLPVFAWKPAPVQATWMGYFATTGLAAIDYVLGDPYVMPIGEENHFVEKVWRLPENYLCFTPPDVAVDCGPLPALEANGVTFGCFNNLTKMNDAVVALWSKVLRAVPNSRLLLKTKQLGEANVAKLTCERFAAHGVGHERLALEGAAPRVELLASYRRVDIALDPFPYPGGTTSAEALWMGVPAITRRGDRFLSHLGESIAHNAGLADWIADDDGDYVAKAVSHAANLDKLAALRAGLRSRMSTSPLCDAARFARHFETALWDMWRRRQNKSGNSI